MRTEDPNKQSPYELSDEADRRFRNGTEYCFRVWEDRSGDGRPIIVINEHFNNQGPAMTDETAGQIGVSLSVNLGVEPTEVHFYRQELNGSLKGYDFRPYESERTKAEDLNHVEQPEADRVLGKEKLKGYFAVAREVSEHERGNIEITQGDLRQPWDVNRLEMPRGFDRTELAQEYPQAQHDRDYGPSR